MVTTRDDIRNIAIIAHVDHGKTTLVDELLKQSGVFRANQEVQERVMDSNDIERERGITILSKNTAVFYKDTKINIIDTPGHADFGGEVERVLKMVNGVVLVVDAFEGTMPQTKFVLMKALALNLPVIVCINKIDRPEARPAEVIDEVLELFMDLDASDEQLDCPFIYASARDGYAMYNLDDEKKDMTPLFETIVNYIPAPTGDPDANTQVLISTIDYNEYVGRIGIGKVDNGSLKVNQEAVVVNHHDPDKLEKVRISKLYEFDGLNKVDVSEAKIGSIVAISGIADIHIGDTICSLENPVAIPFQKISEPTISMNFIVNDSPLAGQEGKYVTSRHIRDRLFRELNTDVSLRVEETDSPDSLKVSGRGELHLSVLIENMRREGYEFAVSKAEVLYHYDENGKKLEPMELAYVDVPDEFTGTIIGVDLYARYLPRSEARMLENKRELCAVVVPYRIPILTRESEMWELGEERPDFVLRNMVGASIDVIVTKVERTANRAQASRRQASRSQRRFFAARENLHAVGSRITCRMLAVGPRRCLVDCYGYDLDITQKEIRYAAIPDLRTEFHPGSEIDCIVKEYHPRTGELIVSAKETEVNPFFGAEERHPVGSRRFAMISGKYSGGVFCNLPDGVTCMCNYFYQHEDADFMVGEHVMLMVQRYDQEKLQMYGKIMSKW